MIFSVRWLKNTVKLKSDFHSKWSRNSIMNYSEILQSIEKESLFDLYRLTLAINAILDQPERHFTIRQHLLVGMEISYFSSRSNKLVDAVIEEIRRSHVCVRDKDDGKRWIVPFYSINLQHVNTDIRINPNRRKIDRNQLQVGETISFIGKDNQEIYGKIIQLNPKTVSVLARDGSRWRVGYHYLSKILDAEGYETFDTKMIDVPTDDKAVTIIDA